MSYDLRHIRSDSPNRGDANWSVSRRAATGLGALRHTLTGLMGGSRYDVQVRAVNAIGEGSWSATASGAPLVQAVCEDSNVVPNASSNTQLVSDCEALLAARDTLAGAGSLNWAGNTPMTRWQGVRLSGPPNRVVGLRIQGPLQGQIAPELGRLSNLTLLDLSYNQLNGTIPAELGDLPNLRFLYLNGNRLTGSIPAELGNVSNLEILYLWSNLLTGMIPPQLSRAGNLRELSISDNRLAGAIPADLGSLKDLTSLALARNGLSGSVPAELTKLGNLQTLKLSGNQLIGCLPVGLRSVEDNDLTNLGLSDCGAVTIPGAPGGMSATANGRSQIDLSWTPPSDDGGAAITGYRIEVSPDRSTWTFLEANTGNTATSYSHSGLAAGITRHYRVSAINSAGTGRMSSIVAATTGAALAPDLVVERPAVDTSAPEAGTRFSLSATVRNQGNGSSDSTTLRYYQSGDSAITTGDTELDTNYVFRLDAGESENESVNLTAPSTPGTYYYGACVDSVSDESNTQNNCSTAVTVTVGAAPAPDLVVDTPTVSARAPEAGTRFTLSATVRNQGNGSSASTTLRYYQSSDSTITADDTEVGTDSVFRLDAGESGAESVRLTAPSTPGTYYYGACVDSTSGESNTQNNCSSAVTLNAGAAPAPDLVVDRPGVSESAPETGARFTLNATVRNQGNGSSASTTLRYYQSSDSTITAVDTEVDSDYVSRLDASESGDESISLTAPPSPGTYYYGACVDSVSDESDTQNNCSSAVTVTVGAAPAPDLVVNTPTVSDSSPSAGASFTLNATVRNQGSGSSDSTTLRYYRSGDLTITSGDTAVDTDSVSRLDASESGEESASLTAPSTPGTYYYGACVDAVSGESNTGNNCSSAVTVTVGAAPTPDLVVERPTVDEGTLEAGASFTLSATVRNQGSGSSDSTTLRYYRSGDSTITSGDTGVGTDSVFSLDASESGDESISLTVPDTPGTYYYGACVEAVSGESDTQNNCSSAVTVTVSASAPASVPNSPTGLTATANEQTRIDLSWSAPSDDGGAAVTGYRIEISTDGSTWSDLVANTNSTGTSYAHTGLDPDNTRHYRVSAINSAGTGPTSNTDSATTDAPEQAEADTCATGGAVSDAANNPGLVSDCEVLLDVKDTLRGDATLNWAADVPMTQWEGIIVYPGTTLRRVTWIALEKNMTGTIPAGLSNLTELDKLALSNNQLTGEIPSEVANLPKLTELTLSNNRLSGNIPPELGNLASLKGMNLSRNQLNGPIPSELGGLASLQSLRLSDNELSGAIPSELGNLSSLTSLILSNNGLNGPIPSELGSLSRLVTLSVSDNELTGAIPPELGRLTRLSRFDFTNNQLSGEIPSELGDLSSLTLLYLSQNRLTGDVPSELGNLGKLEGLFLYGNQLTGCVPANLESQLDRSTLWAVGLPFCPTATAPGAPTGLAATADGQTNVDLSWTAPSDDGGADITGYRIEVSTDGSNWSDLVADTNTTDTSYSHTGLTAESTRHYRVSAINSAGTGPASDTDSATTAAATKPGEPAGLTAAADGQTEIDLSWTAPSDDGGADITGYRIEVSTDGSSWSDLEANTSSTSTSYAHTGLAAGSTRHYRVSAINSAGTGPASGADSATTATATKPGRPTGLTATADGQTEIDLSWTAPSDNGGADITGYRIEISEDSSTWSDLVANTNTTGASYSHTDLEADSTRYYRVSAINSAGTGPASNVANATTDAAAPPATDGTCTVNLIVRPGESCTYPGTSDDFSVDSDGTGRFLFFSSGESIAVRNSTINGVTYTFVASKQDDGNWNVEEVG